MAPDPPSVAILWLNCYRDVWRTIAYDVGIDYRTIYRITLRGQRIGKMNTFVIFLNYL
jgi:hypothetical protein